MEPLTARPGRCGRVSDENRKVRLIIVDDHPVVCEGLKSILTRSSRIDLVGICCKPDDALRLAIKARVDVMLISSRMASMSGMELLWLIIQNQIGCKALVLANTEIEDEVLESMAAGAAGYLCKNLTASELLDSIFAAASGQKIFPKGFSDARVENAHRVSLTTRQREVLHLVSKGLSNKEAGNVLGLSQFTVRNQLKRICVKLDVSDRTEAATAAMERGMIRQ